MIKHLILFHGVFFLATVNPAAQGQETAATRYRNAQAQHLSADERIAYYEKLLKQSPNDPKAETALASAFIQKLRETTDFAHLNRAATLVERIVKADPRSYDGIRLSAEIETHRHNFSKAADLARELTERNPSDAGSFGILGDSLMEMGRYDEAGDAYQRMLEIGPNLTSYNRVAYQKFVTGNSNEAVSWMSLAVKAGSAVPENRAWCLVEFGDMLFKIGRPEDARSAYKQALEALPGYHRALASQAKQYAAEGRFDQALQNYQRAQSVIPLPEYVAASAILYEKLGQKTQADQQRKVIDVIDKLGRVNGEKGNRMLALVYADENRNLDRALELVKAELENRKDVYTYDALSWVLFRSGRQKEAEEASTKALALHTPDPMLLYHGGVIAMAVGKREQGAALLRQALALNPTFSYPQAEDAKQKLSQAGVVASLSASSTAP
jgi:tetratricopeptide (TPR) repeat protein